MSLIKNIFLLVSTFIFCYLLLIIGDFIISESVSGKNNKIVLESEKLINKRKMRSITISLRVLKKVVISPHCTRSL